MARFSQALLQGLLQPQMQQGLFETARNIGMTPSLMRAEQQRQEQMQRMQGMGPVDLASMAEQQALQTGDPAEILKAQQGTQSVIRERTKRSLASLEAERQKKVREGDINGAKQIEAVMSRVAASAGIDPSEIEGRTKEKTETLKDYSLTEREETIYMEIFKDNKEEFKSLIETVEEEPLFTIPFLDVPVGGGKDAVVDLDDSTKTLFDNAERIRTNNPEMTKRQSLKQAIEELNSEAIYKRLPEEAQSKVNQLRARGVSEQAILEAMKVELNK
jgi:hypothetical protein